MKLLYPLVLVLYDAINVIFRKIFPWILFPQKNPAELVYAMKYYNELQPTNGGGNDFIVKFATDYSVEFKTYFEKNLRAEWGITSGGGLIETALKRFRDPKTIMILAVISENFEILDEWYIPHEKIIELTNDWKIGSHYKITKEYVEEHGVKFNSFEEIINNTPKQQLLPSNTLHRFY